MTIGEWDCEAVRRCVRKPLHAVRGEIVILLLFAVCDDRRTRGFETLNGVSYRIFIERSEVGMLSIAFCDSLDEIKGSWDTANGLSGYRDRCGLSHAVTLT